MRTINLVLLFILIFFNVSGQNNFLTDSLDTYVVREMNRWKVPGAAIAIVKDGKVMVMKGYGVRETGKPGKVNEQTLFQIASNTKLFTATCVTLLNKQKRLSLDDKIISWIKDFRLYDSLATRDVTIRDMLTHRIGYLTFQSDFLNWNCNLTRQELIHNMRNVKPYYGFRSKWGYCNMGYVTAGEIIRLATDTSWEDFVRAHLFMPLHMNHTSVSFTELINDTNAAYGHTELNDTTVQIPYANIDNIGPCASVNSCILDMANWLLMELDSGRFEGRTIVPMEAVKETWRSQMLMSDQSDPLYPMKHFSTYGLGLELGDFAGKKVMSHSGGSNGFLSQVMFVPELQFGMVVLTNSEAHILFDALCYQVLESFLDLPYRNLSEIYFGNYQDNIFARDSEIKSWKERTALKPETSLPLDRYAGKYNNIVYGDIEIKKENNRLTIYFPHHPKNSGTLEAYGANDFICTYSDITWGIQMVSFTSENEKVKTVSIRINDNIDLLPYEFTKVN